MLKIKGLREFQRKLDDLGRWARRLDGTHDIAMKDLFTPAFMQRHTDFSSFEEMLAASGFHVETTEDFKAIPDDQWDAFVAARTRFSTWSDMLSRAGSDWSTKQLGL